MKRLSYAIVFVSDMKRSVAFYRDILGLPLKFGSDDWTEFSNEGSTIALHRADSINPPGISQGQTPAGSCQLGFEVENLDRFHAEMQKKGVVCAHPPKMQDFGGRLALYADPDGLLLAITEGPGTK